MSKIDDELAKAVQDSEADEAARPVVVQDSGEPSKKPKRELILLGTLVAIGAAILVLMLGSRTEGAVYSKSVDEMLAQKEQLADRKVRVQGTLVKGTLARRDSPCEYRFRMKKNNAEIEVRYPQCVVPDTFRDVPNMDVDVTAEGKLAKDGHFQASAIMAKCPSKYDMKQMQASGKQMPHGMGPSAESPAAQPY